MTGWLGAASVPRVNRGANFLNGSSRYFSQRPSGSIVCRSLSITLNPFFMAGILSRVLAVPELERNLVAGLADVPGELLRGVVEPRARAGDADGGHALAARIEDRRRHRRD